MAKNSRCLHTLSRSLPSSPACTLAQSVRIATIMGFINNKNVKDNTRRTSNSLHPWLLGRIQVRWTVLSPEMCGWGEGSHQRCQWQQERWSHLSCAQGLQMKLRVSHRVAQQESGAPSGRCEQPGGLPGVGDEWSGLWSISGIDMDQGICSWREEC